MIHGLRAKLRRNPLWRRASTVAAVRRLKGWLWPTPILLPEHLYRRLSRRSTTFRFHGEDYAYFFHRYQVAGLTERTVEIPIAADLVRGYPPDSVLEVGNVLSHYVDVTHDVVDKYEFGRGVENTDVLDYRPERYYDLIVSVSTLEHVGWDESPRDELKWLRAVRHLRTLLTPKGVLFASIPVGWNPHVDAALRAGVPEFDELYGMRRITRENDWLEARFEEVLDAQYGNPFPFANALIFALAHMTLEGQAGRPPL
jgi:SAM-dependent methyltransferase